MPTGRSLMRRTATAVILALLGTASIAMALPTTTSNVLDMDAAIAEKNANLSGNTPTEPASEGGENAASAIVINALPYCDTGNTCNNIDDYDAVCPYTGSISPDVVYRYTPAVNEQVDIDLCASLYDTKVYVWAGVPGNLVACNDDASCGITGFQSKLRSVPMTAGTPYWIVVDGYGGDCGDYSMCVRVHVPCPAVACPPAHQDENEPNCGPGYIDVTNGGCNSAPPVFTTVSCNTICGKAGTYVAGGIDTRDTDWYALTTTGGGTGTVTVVADFPVQLAVLNPSCNPISVLCGSVFGAECQPVSCSFPCGQTVWIFVGPSVFDGIPCGYEYLLTFSGCNIPPCQPTATENTTWGQVKGLYR
jgi:hypothetical protein